MLFDNFRNSVLKFVTALSLAVVWVFSGSLASAQNTAGPATTTAGESHDHAHETHADKIPEEPEKRLSWFLKEHNLVRQHAVEFSGKPFKPEPQADRVLLLVRNSDYGIVYEGSNNGHRYLLGQINLINNTKKTATMTRKGVQIKLEDEAAVPQSTVPEKIRGHSFQIENSRSLSFGNLDRPDNVTVKPGETGSMWFYFDELTAGSSFPESVLSIEVDGKPVAISLHEHIIGQLRLRKERIGPNGALAMIHVGGRLNILGLSLIADILDSLQDQKVFRAVIQWDQSVEQIDSGVMNLLYQYANTLGQDNNNNRPDQRYPILSKSLREVHLVHTPGHNYSSSNQHKVTHKEPIEAVTAALWSLLTSLPKEELLRQIQSGHPLVKPVALTAGAALLSPRELPIILELSQQKEDKNLQFAAVHALRQFGDPAAVNRLLELAESSSEEITSLAIACLTQSRFETGRTALRELLKTAKGEKRLQLLKVIAENPSPAFSDLYYDNVIDQKSKIRVESLEALNAVGHPELHQLLRSSLDDTDDGLREAAFKIVLQLRTPELEPLIEELVLTRLEAGELDSSMQNYLRQNKNPRAVPFLLDRLVKNKKEQSERQMLIPLLATLGDERIEPIFSELYVEISEHEKRQVLEALGNLQSAKFLEFAREALASESSSLVYSAINHLSHYDSREAEQILIEGLSRIKSKSYFDNLANAIAQIGSEEAAETLRAAMDSENPDMRKAARNGLRYYQQRLPGYQYISQAMYRMRQRKWEEALDYIHIAIEIDSKLARAYSVKGDILLKLKKIDEADEAYQTALKIDASTGEAVAGRLRIQARKGNIPEALKAIQEGISKFQEEPEFEYQLGLLYADAVNLTKGRDPDDPLKKDQTPKDELPDEKPAEESTEKTETPEDDQSKKQLALWTNEALSWVSNAARHGFRDRSLIQNTPELEPFKTHDDYQKAVNGQLPERPVEPADENSKQASQIESFQEGDAVILRVGGELGDGNNLVNDLPSPPER
ncbi:MAG: HEAT repeat domain-containing protein [Planctomycetaceae bacterium]|nr:HEAT repeat domain-containing protein [Planctomycetaceae bacterium]